MDKTKLDVYLQEFEDKSRSLTTQIKDVFSTSTNIDDLNKTRKTLEQEYVIQPIQLITKDVSPENKKALGILIKNNRDLIYCSYQEKKSTIVDSPASFQQPISNKSLLSVTSLSSQNKNIHNLNNPSSLNKPLPNHNLSYTSNNLLNNLKQEILEYFSSLSFEIQYASDIVEPKDNFDRLLIPATHPSRDASETFYISDTSHNNYLLRTHCTSNSVKNLYSYADKTIPHKLVTIGEVYRRDEKDATHLEQFNQIDFLWVESNLTVPNLKWFVNSFFQHLFGAKYLFRFRVSNFPFTNPSYELDIECKCEDASICSMCKGTKWLELMGFGLLSKEILDNAGFPQETQALAGGIGIERLAMIKYGIKDIRDLYRNNFRTLVNDNN